MLYFISSTASDAHDVQITVGHLRYQDGAVAVVGTNLRWHPFPYRVGGINTPLLTIAIFTQGAWSVSAGVL